jgi:hypothetical protein
LCLTVADGFTGAGSEPLSLLEHDASDSNPIAVVKSNFFIYNILISYFKAHP